MSKQQPAQRRRFLKTASAGAVGAAAMAAPMVSVAQTTSLRFQSTWPTKDIFHEYAQRLRQEGQRHGGRPAEDRSAALRRGRAGVPVARRGGQGHARRRARRRRLPLRQELRARAVGLGPGYRHGPEHAARVALLRRRQGAARGDLQEPEHGRRVVPVRADADAAARLVQEAGRQGRGHEGPEVPHRRPVGRHLHRRWARR